MKNKKFYKNLNKQRNKNINQMKKKIGKIVIRLMYFK